LEQLSHLSSKYTIRLLPDGFDTKNGSFMDTAAIMHHLDVIITVDTSLAHLAGGLGRPIWVILPHRTDWRWLQNRTDSPWYPTMKLFRQETPQQWDHVLELLKQEIQTLRTKSD
jgi:ADP-heptose:LPS heptosyltransferase